MLELKGTYLQRLAGMLEPVPDAARMLGVSRQRVLQLIESRRLEAVKLGRDYFISSLSLQEYLDARVNKPLSR
jgi:excisionase family DNA binding protein